MVGFHRYIAFACALCFCALHAQDEKRVSFECRVFGIGKDSYEGLYYFNGTDFNALQFHRTHRSPEKYSCNGTLPLGIFVRNPKFDLNDPESPEFIRVASSDPPQAREQLIVFAANANNREVADANRSFTLFHINDSLEDFGRNSIVLLNTTGADLFGRIDGQYLSLPTGASNPIPYKSTSSKSATRIAFALATRDGTRLVMSNDLAISDNRRVLIILEPPRRQNSYRVAVRVLSESVFLAEEE